MPKAEAEAEAMAMARALQLLLLPLLLLILILIQTRHPPPLQAVTVPLLHQLLFIYARRRE